MSSLLDTPVSGAYLLLQKRLEEINRTLSEARTAVEAANDRYQSMLAEQQDIQNALNRLKRP